MLSRDERLVAVKKRAACIEKEKARHRRQSVIAASAALCLAILAGVSVWMPRAGYEAGQGMGPTSGLTGSIFAQNNWISYLILALLAFALGICFTILCFLLSRKHGSGDDNDS